MPMGHCPTLFSLRTVSDTKVTVVEQSQELFTPPPCSNQLQHPVISFILMITSCMVLSQNRPRCDQISYII